MSAEANANRPASPPIPTADMLPPELVALPQWVCWRYELQGNRWTKPPLRMDGRRASSTNAARWTDFDTARRVASEKGFDGVGFVFAAGDPYCGVDLDDALDENGVPLPWAAEIIAAMASYTEISPSGAGVKIWVKASLGGRAGTHASTPHGIEIYDRARYFTVTGRRLHGTPFEIAARQKEVDDLYARLIDAQQEKTGSADTPASSPSSPPPPLDVPDEQLLDVARGAKNGAKLASLWGGSTEGYGSASEADLALASILAFYAGPDPARIERLMRQSGLVRDKWTKNKQYLARTIATALKGKTEFYRPTTTDITIRDDLCLVGTQTGAQRPKETRKDSYTIYNLTDLGNAQRLADHFEPSLRYCAASGQWLVWDGRRWKDDDTCAVVRAACELPAIIRREAKGCGNAKLAKAIMGWASISEGRTRVEAAVALARAQMSLVVRLADLDADDWALCVLNGTIDLRTGTLRPHRREDYITKMAPVEYDPQAACPLFLKFLDRVFAGDASLISYVLQFFGVAMTGDVTEQIMPLFWGGGANGKSVLIDTVKSVFGDYATDAPPGLLVETGQERHPTEIADLQGRRLVVASETEQGASLKLQLVKRLTGDATLKGRRMRQDFFEFRRTHKLLMVTNNRPRVKENSEAAWRRLPLVPFTVTIPLAERDPKLLEKLRTEGPGILALCVQACLEWQREGLRAPRAVSAATHEYRAEEDIIGRWIEERCHVGGEVYATYSSLRADYGRWCDEVGERPLGGRAFGEALDKKGIRSGSKRVGAKAAKVRLGIALRAPTDDEPAVPEDLRIDPPPGDAATGDALPVTGVTQFSHYARPARAHESANLENRVTPVTGNAPPACRSSPGTAEAPQTPCNACHRTAWWRFAAERGPGCWTCQTCHPFAGDRGAAVFAGPADTQEACA